MGTLFNIVCCESSNVSNNNFNKKKIKKSNTINAVKVSDLSSSELICSTIIPKEIYKDQPKRSFSLLTINTPKKIKDDIFEKYEKISILGKNNYSLVYKVKNKLSNKLQSKKKILKAKIENSEDTKHIINSINTIRNLRHSNLNRLYEFYEDEKYFYLINDLCDGLCLDKIIDNQIKLCEFIVKYIMYYIFLALKFLHKYDIIHGDIKITNIGFMLKEKYRSNNNNDIKIISIKDLIYEIGNDIKLQEELLNYKNYEMLSFKAKQFIKNLMNFDIKLLDCWSQEIFVKNFIDYENEDILLNINYFSPELFDGKMVKQRDEWSCGILMFKLLTGYHPFEGDDKNEIVFDIMNDNLEDEIMNLKVSKECKDLLKKLLNKNPDKRIKVEEILELNYFKNIAKLKYKNKNQD